MDMPHSDLPAPAVEVPGSLKALLDKIIDFAGSFPPAALPLVTALEKYAEYRTSPWSWILARFVCPAGSLVELSDHVRATASAEPLRFAVLSAGGETDGQFLTALEADLRAAAHFKHEHGGDVEIRQLEARLPTSLLKTDVVTIRKLLDGIDAALDTAELRGAAVHLEIPMDENLRQTLPVVAGAVRGYNRERDEQDAGLFGLKMRTGGTTDSPSVEQVAQVIAGCRDADVPFKATAGLHHPLRRINADADMHGFLNVFVAAVLADVHQLDEESLARVLADDDPSDFVFESDRLSWTHLTVDVPAVERIRRRRALSFGSCSFAEPITDLKALEYF